MVMASHIFYYHLGGLGMGMDVCCVLCAVCEFRGVGLGAVWCDALYRGGIWKWSHINYEILIILWNNGLVSAVA